jgi:Transposase
MRTLWQRGVAQSLAWHPSAKWVIALKSMCRDSAVYPCRRRLTINWLPPRVGAHRQGTGEVRAVLVGRPIVFSAPSKRRQYSEALKRQMVAETQAPGASVSIVARRHDAGATFASPRSATSAGHSCLRRAGGVHFQLALHSSVGKGSINPRCQIHERMAMPRLGSTARDHERSTPAAVRPGETCVRRMGRSAPSRKANHRLCSIYCGRGPDFLLEEDGFEPSVPRGDGSPLLDRKTSPV